MKHRIRKGIEKLIEMVKEVKDVNDVIVQAKKVRNDCLFIKRKLENYNIALSSLHLLLDRVDVIARKGYNTDDMEDTLHLCESMLKLDAHVQKQIEEFEEKTQVQRVLAQEALKKIEFEEKLLEKTKKEL